MRRRRSRRAGAALAEVRGPGLPPQQRASGAPYSDDKWKVSEGEDRTGACLYKFRGGPRRTRVPDLRRDEPRGLRRCAVSTNKPLQALTTLTTRAFSRRRRALRAHAREGPAEKRGRIDSASAARHGAAAGRAAPPRRAYTRALATNGRGPARRTGGTPGEPSAELEAWTLVARWCSPGQTLRRGRGVRMGKFRRTLGISSSCHPGTAARPPSRVHAACTEAQARRLTAGGQPKMREAV